MQRVVKVFHLTFVYAAQNNRMGTVERAVPETRQKYPQRYNSCPNVVSYQVISLGVFLFGVGCFIFPSSSCLSLYFRLYAQNAELSIFMILLIKAKPRTTECMVMLLSKKFCS